MIRRLAVVVAGLAGALLALCAAAVPIALPVWRCRWAATLMAALG